MTARRRYEPTGPLLDGFVERVARELPERGRGPTIGLTSHSLYTGLATATFAGTVAEVPRSVKASILLSQPISVSVRVCRMRAFGVGRPTSTNRPLGLYALF